MKANKNGKKNHTSTADTEPQAVPVRFEFESAAAKSVCIAGTFNEWNPSATVMKTESSGRWAKELALLPGAYEYCFVVDDVWVADPRAAETTPNPFGGLNSVLRVSRRTEGACPADQQHLQAA